ncbi:glycosyltransferase family 4 protein [Caulobacter sp. BK020]|uniref:glycosyltransferase family 4 protein n=1 Tax=Caulobacter sp. BK020 TaxID=2512117 RepID=UPI0010497EE8|nr:glycosyltransferase family 4 protein [Caulobacter sp. BK020]TCS14918.1 glycosyltransferase involved in cell wall biosynthesis [Caulobacter sp. BK020]
MKLALVVPGGVDRSGERRVIPCLLWLIERLVASGDEVHVFVLGQEPEPGEWRLLGARVRNAGRRPRRFRTLVDLAAEHRRGSFDVVHAFWAAGPGAVAALFGRLTGTPVVLTLPGGDLSALADIGYGARLTPGGRFWTRLALAGARRVVVQSDWMAQQARAFGVETVRIPFGVALDRWPAAPPRPRTPGTPLRLAHVANLNRVKDQETLLRAMRASRDRGVDWRLDIVGQDTLDGAVQRRCAALGLADLVTFHGFLPHADTRPVVEAADLMVVSSRHEAGPLVVLEAAVAGLPTVGTRVGHIADWAPEAAIATPIGDPEALAEAISRLAADEPERLRLARAAQALALAEDADATAALMRRVYVEVAAR